MTFDLTARCRSAVFGLALLVMQPGARADNDEQRISTRLNEMTIAQLQAEMAGGQLSSEQLTRYYLRRIAALDQGTLGVNSVIELNPG